MSKLYEFFKSQLYDAEPGDVILQKKMADYIESENSEVRNLVAAISDVEFEITEECLLQAVSKLIYEKGIISDYAVMALFFGGDKSRNSLGNFMKIIPKETKGRVVRLLTFLDDHTI